MKQKFQPGGPPAVFGRARARLAIASLSTYQSDNLGLPKFKTDQENCAASRCWDWQTRLEVVLVLQSHRC